MEYNINILAEEYIKYLSTTNFDINPPLTQTFETSSYNDIYQGLMLEMEKEYSNVDSLELTEKFLKGD